MVAAITALKKQAHRALNSLFADERFSQTKHVLDDFLPFALLLVTLLLVFEFFLHVPERANRYVTYVNWGVMGYFAVRLAVDFKLADPEEPFIRNHWLDIIMVIPLFSMMQQARLASIAREAELIALAEEEARAATALRNTGVAAKITKTIRLLKRSV